MNNLRFALSPSEHNPEYLSAAIKPFTANDFDAAQLSANTPTNYATPKTAAETLEGLSEYAYRYAITNGVAEEKTPIGEVSLMDKNLTTAQKVARHLMLDKIGIGRSNARTISGWYDSQAVAEEVEVFSTEIVDRLVRTAKQLGLRSVETLVSTEQAGKNPRLVVVEHTADLELIGFEQIADASGLRDQGRTFSGSRWRIDI